MEPRRIPLIAHDICAALAVLTGTFFPAPPRTPWASAILPEPGLTYALLLAAVLTCLLLRRHWPIVSVITAGLTFLLATWLHLPSLGIGIGLVICTYALAVAETRLIAFGLSAAIALPLVMQAGIQHDWQGIDPNLALVAGGVAVAAALGNGEQSRRRSIALALARAETAERTREALAQQRVSDERL